MTQPPLPQLPPLPAVDSIYQRMWTVFPAGTRNRTYLTREIAAKTVFVMLCTGAVEPNGRWLRPDQVTRMTDEQTELTDDEAREAWLEESMRRTTGDIQGRWYSANTRESIRDETLRDGLVPTGAVTVRTGLPTTSPQPRYALTKEFADLFDPSLTGRNLEEVIRRWQESNLSAGARARVAVVRQGAVAARERILVQLPNGEVRSMDPGPSSVVTKAVVEEFAPRFLADPGIIWISESGNKVVARDDQMAQQIGLNIEPDRNLPDLILVDAGRPTILVFAEVVVTAGEINERRQGDLLKIATDAGFSKNQVTFVSAFADRSHAAFRRLAGNLAWRSFAWSMSEPDHIIMMYGAREPVRPTRLSDLMGI